MHQRLCQPVKVKKRPKVGDYDTQKAGTFEYEKQVEKDLQCLTSELHVSFDLRLGVDIIMTLVLTCVSAAGFLVRTEGLPHQNHPFVACMDSPLKLSIFRKRQHLLKLRTGLISRFD